MADVFRLPNGVSCVTEERPGTQKVVMRIVVKYGSQHEAPDENGLTHFMEEACFGGTTTRSRDQIAWDIELNGGSVSSLTTRASTYFAAMSAATEAGSTFAVLADVVRNPVFAADEVRKTRIQIEELIDQKGKDPGQKALDKFYEAVFPGQAIAGPQEGTKDLLRSYTIDQIRKKHADILANPERIVVSFAGDIDSATAQKLVADHFGDLLPAQNPVPASTLSFGGGDIREHNDNKQMNIRFGFPAPSGHDPRKYTFTLLNELMSGGMSSPLFQEVREKRGLVYSVGSVYAPMESSGMFVIAAGAGRGNAGALVKTSFDVLGDIIKNGFPQKDIDDARAHLLKGMEGAQENLSACCERNASHVLSYGRVVDIEEYRHYLEQVTSDDLRRACASLLETDVYGLASIGPQDTMPAEADIKAMMRAQLQGIVLPPATAAAVAPPAKFSSSAQSATLGAGGDPEMTVLPNGMKIITVERPGTLSCGAWVGAGSDHETPKLNGATHMNEHMMFKGTPSYGVGDIDRIIERDLHGGLNAYTKNDKTAYYFFNLDRNGLEQTVDICGEMVFKANISNDEFNGKTTLAPDGTQTTEKGERDVVIEEIKRNADNFGSQGWHLTFGLAYPGQSHGREVLGTESTLRAMTVEELRAYRDEYYAPNNVTFIAVGPVKHQDFVDIVERKYGAMPFQPVPPLPVPQYVGGTSAIEFESSSEEDNHLCNLILGFESVSADHPDSCAYDVLSEVLGGGFAARLNTALVNRRELTSGIGAYNISFRNCGTFAVSGPVMPDKAKSLVEGIYEEMRDLANTLDESELAMAKAGLKMGVISGMETNKGACHMQGEVALAYGCPLSVTEMTALIQVVTLDDVKRVLNKILASNPTLAIVAPKGTDLSVFPAHDEVLALRDRGLPLPPPAAPAAGGPVPAGP